MVSRPSESRPSSVFGCTVTEVRESLHGPFCGLRPNPRSSGAPAAGLLSTWGKIMFGFGRRSNEKAVINQFALQFEAIGLDSSAALQNATKLVDEVLEETRPRGIDPFKSTQGNEYAERETFVSPRIAAGLTVADIKNHWNRPLLIVLCEMKMRELINFIVVDTARQQGRDTGAASLQYKQKFPRYGDPSVGTRPRNSMSVSQ